MFPDWNLKLYVRRKKISGIVKDLNHLGFKLRNLFSFLANILEKVFERSSNPASSRYCLGELSLPSKVMNRGSLRHFASWVPYAVSVTYKDISEIHHSAMVVKFFFFFIARCLLLFLFAG